jgi:gluconate 5-dehydrogenase
MDAWLGLAGRRALVVGAGGFGEACTTALVDEGASVYVADIDEARVQALTSSGDGTTISGGRWDVRDAEQCRALVEAAVGSLGGLDILIHAVGVNDRRPVLDMDRATWDRILSINLSSAFDIGQAAGRHFVERGYGRVVLFSSVSGLLAHPNHAPYAVSKGGMNQLLKVMAIEWADRGVTVNGVAPGYTDSELTAAHLAEPGVRDGLEAMVPAGRLGTLDDVVGPVLFLCSDRSAFMTGQVLYIDGGRILD